MGTDKKIVITVHPAGGKGRALSVQDAMEQVLDYVQILRSIHTKQRAREYDWELISASTNSPFTVGIAPFGDPKTYLEWSPSAIEDGRFVSSGLGEMVEGGSIPPWLDKAALSATKRMVKRNLNGVGLTEISVGGEVSFVLDPQRSSAALKAIELFSAPEIGDVGPHRAKGEISGRMVGVGDYYRKYALWILHNGREIPCTLDADLMDKVGGETRLRDVWKNRHVTVGGIKLFDAKGRLKSVTLTDEPRLREKKPVGIDAIIDADFTGGVSAADYVKGLRGEA